MNFYFRLLQVVVGDIHVFDLTSNPGLLAVSSGTASISTGALTLIHLINLDYFKITLSQVDLMAQSLPKINEFRGILDTKIFTLHKALDSVLPKTRSKRWDALGSGIKWMAGNADADDLVDIYKNFDDLHSKQKELIDSNNDQIKLNDVFEDRINELSRLISQSIPAKINETVDSLQFVNLMINLDLARSKLEDIHEAISLSRIKVLSKNILGEKELEFIAGELKRQKVNFTSTSEMFTYLTPSFHYENEVIHFHIHIPQVENGFEKLIIEPLTKDNKEIEIAFNEILIKNEKTFAIIENCHEAATATICFPSQLKNIEDNQCIAKLARAQHADCIFKEIGQKPSAKLIGDGQLLVKNVIQPILLINSCGMGSHSITGSFLISFRNCSVTVFNNRCRLSIRNHKQAVTIVPNVFQNTRHMFRSSSHPFL